MKTLALISDKEQALKLTSGTHLVGKLTGVMYRDLVNTFGEPTFLPEDSGDGKVNFEWVFQFGGKYYTVYDWKVSEEYTRYNLGRLGEVQFHVGGTSNASTFISHLQKKVVESVGSLS